MPTARSVRLSEIDEAVDVAMAAFEVSPEGEEEWRSGWHRHAATQGLDHILVVEHEGRLISSMVLHTEPMWMGDSIISASAVAGVGTLPEARRLGGAAAMLTETVHRLKAWGSAASPMWPFSFRYYRKFGWEIGGEVRATEWDRDVEWQVPALGDVEPISESHAPEMAEVWDEQARGRRCGTVRSREEWESLFTWRGIDGRRPDRGGFLCRQDGEAAGYVCYRRPKQTEGEEPKPLDISEIRARNAGAEIALLKAVADANPEFASFKANFPANHRLRSVVVEQYDVETEMAASFAFRIIDPAAIFPLLRTDHPTEPVTWRVVDKMLGTSTWRVPLNGTPAEPSTTEPAITCTIETFSQIASGYLKPVTAAWAGLLEGDHGSIKALEAATCDWGIPYRSNLEAG